MTTVRTFTYFNGKRYRVDRMTLGCGHVRIVVIARDQNWTTGFYAVKYGA